MEQGSEENASAHRPRPSPGALIEAITSDPGAAIHDHFGESALVATLAAGPRRTMRAWGALAMADPERLGARRVRRTTRGISYLARG